MLTDEETRARNIQVSRAAARRVTRRDAFNAGPRDWIKPPDATIRLDRRWPWVVYVLRRADESVLYVGYTKNIYKRLADHLGDATKVGICDVDVYGCYGQKEAEALEARLIEFFKPPCNRKAGNSR